MKKLVLFVLMILMLFAAASAEENADWTVAPVITQAYEISSGNLYLEWEGNAPLYQVYMDGKSVTSVIVNNAVIPVKKGTHSICIYPISEAKEADTRVSLNVSVIDLDLDLAALGLDSKNLSAGTPSVSLNIDYVENSLFAAAPDQLVATTDFEDQVLLSFSDKYHADEYLVSVKSGNDVNYVKFSVHSEEAGELIGKAKNTVTLTLDPEYLQKQECMIPELDNPYTFTVQLRKYAENRLDGSDVTTVIHESKESKAYQYTPTAAWKTTPVISYASQTADGQITLQWTHDDNGLGCEYAVMKINKKLMIKTGEEELGVTAEREFVIDDLLNGDYYIAVVPRYNGEAGFASEEASVSVSNEWVVAPVLTCEQTNKKAVTLTWTAAPGVETYHITVYKGDNESLLRFVNLDYAVYEEYDIPAENTEMEYVFKYDGEISEEVGERFRFEIYGVHHTSTGEEQKTALTRQLLTMKTEYK